MKLPDQIPQRLRNVALFLPQFDDGEGAWLQVDAVAVIESLKGTTVSISDVVILHGTPGGYIPSDSALSVERFHNEPDTDYAERSRSLALDFIRDCETANNETVFALTFSLWKDAA